MMSAVGGDVPYKAILLLICLTMQTHAGNILLVPNPAHSHVRYFVQASGPLVERGHNVYAVINGACTKAVAQLQAAGIQQVPYYTANRACLLEDGFSQDMKDKMADALMKPQSAVSIFRTVYMQSAMFQPDMHALFADATLFDRLRALHIDIALIDGMPLTLYNYIVPYKLDLPYMTLTTGYDPAAMGVPDLPSFSPLMVNAFSDRMSFLQRVQNTVGQLLGPYLRNLFACSTDALVAAHAPEKDVVTLIELQRRSRLWLVNSDSVLDYPRTSFPHVVHIGGLSTEPAHALPAHIAAITDAARDGFIIVSFGSLLDGLPAVAMERLQKALFQIKDVTIIWKHSGAGLRNVPSNIKLLPWLPQNDLLGHPKARVFVTHCGNNGQYEALYHGVPMVGVPVFGDQPYNAVRMEAKGFGLHMPLSELDSDELVRMIQTVLNNKTFSENIKKAARIYRSQPETAQQRAVRAVEQFLLFGSDHLRPYGLQLPWYQFWLIDVFVFLLAILTGVVVISRFLLCCCLGCCSKNRKEKLS